MKNGLFILLFLCISMPLWTQTTTDSKAISNVNWKTVKVSKGLKWHHFHFSDKQLFNSNQNIHFLKIKNNHRKGHFELISAGDSLVKTSELALQSPAEINSKCPFR